MNKTVFIVCLLTVLASTYVDYGISYNAIKSGIAAEGNPLVKGFVTHPEIAIPIITISNGAACFGFNELWKSSKTAGWVALGLLAVVKGFVLVHNLHVARSR